MDLMFSRFISFRDDLDELPLVFLRRAVLEDELFRPFLEDEPRRFSFAMTPPIESRSTAFTVNRTGAPPHTLDRLSISAKAISSSPSVPLGGSLNRCCTATPANCLKSPASG
jgi:hypothetical protein